MTNAWIQSTTDEEELSFWTIENSKDYIVAAFDNPEGLDSEWIIVDAATDEVLASGHSVDTDAAKAIVDIKIAELIESAFGNVWSFDNSIEAYVSNGEKPDFKCSCGRKLALSSESMTACPACETQWISWSVNSEDKLASPTKNFVRSVIKRENVILAAVPNSDDDNEVEDYTTIDKKDEDEDEKPTRVHGALDEYTEGFKLGETENPLPAEFTARFKEGYVAALEERLRELKSD